MYQQRIANEVRILEDQLYEADYENRKLRDELERIKSRGSAGTAESRHHRSKSQSDYGPPIPSPDPMSSGPLYGVPESIDSFDLEQDFGDSLIDPGQAVPMDRLNNPFTDEPGGMDAPRSDVPRPNESKRSGDNREQPLVDPAPRVLPPPIGVPEPPGKSDTEVAPIEPGEILPPPSSNGKGQPKPPGQIILPDAAEATQEEISAPETLQLHTGLSGGHQSDNDHDVDGLYLVINALDHYGKTVNLEDFEIDAEMSIVILDPAREPSEAKIGRWEFSAEEVSELIRSRPLSGFHVPVIWQDVEPQSDEVIVHVRLRSEGDEMRCKGRVQVAETGVIAKWTPRGDAEKR
ncbi:hypothetical protein [Novipirellula maiorica]|uniref:hypothetical protein n=1 Tax=Novipirellula maiorica TaxID=1265734 RepID=UPI001181813D|nr:hypothetical protein [Rhodopirellula maiorica]